GSQQYEQQRDRQRWPARLTDDRHRVHRREQVHAEMDERNQKSAENSKDGRVARAERRRLDGATQHHVRYVDEPQKERGNESHIPPRPEGSPDRLGPKGTSDQHDGGKNDADLGRAFSEPVEPDVTQPEIDRTGGGKQ